MRKILSVSAVLALFAVPLLFAATELSASASQLPPSPQGLVAPNPQAADAAQKRWGVVELSANFMREDPSYDAELGTQSLMGSVVEVLDHSSYWTKVLTCEPYVAWVTNLGLVEMNAVELRDYLAAPKVICTVPYTHIFTEPTDRSLQLCDFILGDKVRVTGERHKCFVKVLLPSGKEGWVRRSEVKDTRKWAAEAVLTPDSIESMAMNFIGVPYLWGGTSIKGVDCSGFVYNVFHMNGVLLPRNASQMARVGMDVPVNQMQKGDLLFFGRKATEDKPMRITHVAIYLGDGRIVHSSHLVRINSLIPSGENYYEREVLVVRRIIGHVDTGEGVIGIQSSPCYFIQ